jgi:hypothetical protein
MEGSVIVAPSSAVSGRLPTFVMADALENACGEILTVSASCTLFDLDAMTNGRNSHHPSLLLSAPLSKSLDSTRW